MNVYFATRHTVWAAATVLVLSALFLLINRPMVIHHNVAMVAFTPAVPLQILTVGILTLALTGRTEQFEFSGIRPLWALRLLNVMILGAVGAGAAVGVAAVSSALGIETGTVGTWATLRAFLGLFGAALGVIAFTDMRLGALCALPLVLIPAALDTSTMPGGSAVGFVLAPEDSLSAWSTSGGLLAVGIVLYVCCYSERNSPSSNRRALIDSRGRRRRAVAP